jgi:hypothetical protein
MPTAVVMRMLTRADSSFFRFHNGSCGNGSGRRGGLGLFPPTGLSRKAGGFDLSSSVRWAARLIPPLAPPLALPADLASSGRSCASPRRDIHNGFGELVGVPTAFGVASHTGFPSGRLTSSNEGTWVLFRHRIVRRAGQDGAA